MEYEYQGNKLYHNKKRLDGKQIHLAPIPLKPILLVYNSQ